MSLAGRVASGAVGGRSVSLYIILDSLSRSLHIAHLYLYVQAKHKIRTRRSHNRDTPG